MWNMFQEVSLPEWSQEPLWVSFQTTIKEVNFVLEYFFRFQKEKSILETFYFLILKVRLLVKTFQTNLEAQIWKVQFVKVKKSVNNFHMLQGQSEYSTCSISSQSSSTISSSTPPHQNKSQTSRHWHCPQTWDIRDRHGETQIWRILSTTRES